MTTKLVYDGCVSDLFRCQHCMCLWLSANRAARAQNKIAQINSRKNQSINFLFFY